MTSVHHQQAKKITKEKNISGNADPSAGCAQFSAEASRQHVSIILHLSLQRRSKGISINTKKLDSAQLKNK
jgi:hypothetical protein